MSINTIIENFELKCVWSQTGGCTDPSGFRSGPKQLKKLEPICGLSLLCIYLPDIAAGLESKSYWYLKWPATLHRAHLCLSPSSYRFAFNLAAIHCKDGSPPAAVTSSAASATSEVNADYY